MGTLSVIIPAWSGTADIIQMTLDLVQQVRPMCDEIVVSDDGLYCRELELASDIYLLHPRVGHGSNLNLGFRASTSEYVALLDSDIRIVDGSLRDLVIPDKVVCPSHPYVKFQGWFVVAPRWVINECPPYDRNDGEREGIDFWTEELELLTKDMYVRSDAVTYHHGNSRNYSEFRRSGPVNLRNDNDGIRGRLERLREFFDAKKMEDAARAEMMAMRMPREVDPHRHKQRMDQDMGYRRIWLHVL